MDSVRAWLTLVRTRGLGPKRIKRLIEQFGGPVPILHASYAALTQAGISRSLAEALCGSPPRGVEQDLEWLAAAPGGRSRHLISFDHPHYPSLLEAIPDPPPILFVEGDIDLLSLPQLAVVGTRNPTAGGTRNGYDFARALSDAGVVITSGLALGIDAAAHQGALAGSGLTVAVAGTGLDRIYPAEHRELASELIARGGAMVSEFPIGTAPSAHNFPRRNRIISGLSLGVLVVEAAARSGSLLTARHAIEQGREVFAIPGSIHNPLSRGCHALIREGGKLVESVSDIVEELVPQLEAATVAMAPSPAPPPRSQPPKTDRAARPVQQSISSPTDTSDAGIAARAPDNHEQQLLALLGYDPTSADDLVERSGLTVNQVSSMLLILELKGLVASYPGGLFARI